MNFVWQIIKKDLRQFRSSLALWLVCFAYIFLVQEKLGFQGNSSLPDYIRLISVISIVVFSCAMLISIVQQDHPTANNAFWRTRPISSGRLVTAKLGLVLTLFVGVPTLTVMVGGWLQDLVILRDPREYGLMVLVLGSVTLSLTAAAACTANITYAIVLWLAVAFGSSTLSEILGKFVPKLPSQIAMQMNLNRILVVLTFSALISLAIILNQYLRRQFTATVILLIFGSVGSALVGVLWGYYYFYQG